MAGSDKKARDSGQRPGWEKTTVHSFYFYLFILSESSKEICEGNASHLRKIIETGNRLREQLGMKFSAHINF